MNVLVVDDEAVIREGIIRSIDWDQYGIKIVGEASNGKEALQIAQETRPDIVIADIRMPVMDGLELSKHLKELMPAVKLIILTGYGEFQYAKKAIEFKVSEFVLKPVGAEELVRIILNLKEEILDEKKRTEDGKSYELLLKENLPVIQGRLINRLINASYGAVEKEDLFKKAEALHMDLSGPRFQVFILAIDDYFFRVGNQYPEKRELILDAVLNIAREAMTSYTKGFICRDGMGLFVGLINAGQHAFNSVAMCRQIQLLISRYLKISVSVGIGNEKSDIFRVFESYEEAFHALRNRIYLGKNVVIHIRDVAKENEATGRVCLHSFSDEEEELLCCLKLIEKDRANDLFDRLFERFIATKADYNHIKNVSLSLLFAAFKSMERMGVHIEERLELQLDPFQEIEKYETAGDIKAWMKDIFGKLIDIIENEKNEKYKSIVKIAIDYIMKHYNEPLSLTAIAGIVHVTPGYFSRVFKEETGESFLEWLNKYRIEKAKEFLTGIGIKTYEVAERVGFNDYKHFSYNFKKYAGCSLTEYKEQRRMG